MFMKTNIIDTAMQLSDPDLLSRIAVLTGRERETTVELVAHLAVLELRPNLYRAQGYGSLFRYCTGALGLSEDAACNRTKVTRACREFPRILDLVAAGTVSLTTVRMLAPHLTAANHEDVLARASNRSREDVEALVAELAPQPDVKASVRKLPTRQEEEPPDPRPLPLASIAGAAPTDLVPGRRTGAGVPDGETAVGEWAASQDGRVPHDGHDEALSPLPRGARPVVRASAPGRYRVQFTIDRETYDELRMVQALLRREIPSGDPGDIFGRALRSLRREVEKAKCRATSSSRPAAAAIGSASKAVFETRIRPRTDAEAGNGTGETTRPSDQAPCKEAAAEGAVVGGGVEAMHVAEREPDGERRPPSRYMPNRVTRAVWWRDRAQCAFVSAGGLRCTERAFLELHHIHPYALGGAATADNIALRCRSHNRYKSELIFGTQGRVGRPGGR
jgi:hypothetical protein